MFAGLLLLTGQPFDAQAQTEEAVNTGGMTDAAMQLLAQAAAQPDDFSIGCVPLSAGGDAVLYNAETPFPLASLSKVFIFIEYARRLEAGLIPWSEMVQVSTLERYNLPRTDRGAHDLFMEQYPAETETLSLWEVAAVGMLQYSSNAASDYLLDTLAPTDWQTLFRQMGLTQTDPPHSLTLIPLLMNNHETGKARLFDVPALSRSSGERYLTLYTTDADWRLREIDYRAGRGSDFPDWGTQAAILQQHTATGTVRDLLRVLQAVYGEDSPLSDGVQSMTRTALRWDGYDYLNATYAEYGSKLGFYSGGTLTLMAYGDPLLGDAVISAILFRNIPREVYRDVLREDAIGDLAHWLNFSQCAGLAAWLP